jgi:hypothetical protein
MGRFLHRFDIEYKDCGQFQVLGTVVKRLKGKHLYMFRIGHIIEYLQ